MSLRSTDTLLLLEEELDAMYREWEEEEERVRRAEERAERLQKDRDAAAEAFRIEMMEFRRTKEGRGKSANIVKDIKLMETEFWLKEAKRELEMEKEWAEELQRERDAAVKALRSEKERAEKLQTKRAEELQKERDDAGEALRSEKERAEELQKERDAAVEALRSEKERANWLRKETFRLNGRIERITSGQEEEEKSPMQMPECGICTQEYSENPDKTPRMLQCGHTVCEECAMALADGNVLKCPFDRKDTPLKEAGVIALPKNYTIVQMMERK